MKNLVVGLFVAFTFLGCKTTETVNSAALPPAPSGFVVVRDYMDSQKIDGADRTLHIQYGWDYTRGTAVQKTFEKDGALRESLDQPTLTLQATDAEMDYAYALVKAEPSLHEFSLRQDALYQGGFSLREPGSRDCDIGSRCVHVVVAGGQDGGLSLAHAIVDLMKRKVVEAHYQGQALPKK
jgi:hypothetical protein